MSCSASSYRLPVVNRDPSAGWVAEGAEIPMSDLTVSEIDVQFCKIAGLSNITRELAHDSSPQAAQEVGNGLARDIARLLDVAFFGSAPAPAPSGLGNLAGVATVDASKGITNLDAFLQAMSNAETAGTEITSFVASPADALALAQLKAGAALNSPLLGSDPSQPTRRLIAGVPLLVSAAIPTGTVWAIPASRATLVVREDATVESDASVFFTSDRVAVRAIMRVGFAFTQPEAITKITTATKAA